MKIKILISVGELLDKISILEIKNQYSSNDFVKKELEELKEIASKNNLLDIKEFCELKEINKRLWDIEDQIRICEKNKIFDSQFIELARSVYTTNDRRYSIKKKINEKMNSHYQEIKNYQSY